MFNPGQLITPKAKQAIARYDINSKSMLHVDIKPGEWGLVIDHEKTPYTKPGNFIGPIDGYKYKIWILHSGQTWKTVEWYPTESLKEIWLITKFGW